AFGLIFALSGAIGPIIGQNYGAVQYDRVRQTVIDSLVVTVAYTAIIWLFLFITKGYITTAFHLDPEATELVIFFINIVIVTFLFNGALFVANATFNNLGYATYSTVLNWGKATIGTIPFVWAGAHYYGAKGAILGQGIGYVVFGVAGVFLCYRVINAIAASQDQAKKELDPSIVVPNIPEFSSGKCAGICVHSEVQDMKPKFA
ncbi:MAG: MATE family efflux transporter, partial [Hyphomicrobiales bacterium]